MSLRKKIIQLASSNADLKPHLLSILAARVKKDPADMSASEINKELDKLDEEFWEINKAMIDAGRGHETFRDISNLSDPLSIRNREHTERVDALNREIGLRYGPRAPSRLPRGFGPRKYR